MDLQVILGDFPRNARHIQGFPRKDVFIVTEEVDERAFLFRGKRGTNAYRFTLRAAGIYADFFRALDRLERPGQFLGVGHFFGNLLPEGGEFLRGDDYGGMTAAFDFALISTLERGADGDDPMGARHFQLEVCIVGTAMNFA